MTQQRRKVRKVNPTDEVVEQEEVEEEEFEEEELEEFEEEELEESELPLGNDSSVLYASTEEEKLEIIFQGQRWIFKYRELTWGEKNACVDQAQSWDQETGFQFSLSKYYAGALTRMLTDSPIRPITETTLSRLDRRIGEQLIAIIPNPMEENLTDLKGR